jgi:hypothetical protein
VLGLYRALAEKRFIGIRLLVAQPFAQHLFVNL